MGQPLQENMKTETENYQLRLPIGTMASIKKLCPGTKYSDIFRVAIFDWIRAKEAEQDE